MMCMPWVLPKKPSSFTPSPSCTTCSSRRWWAAFSSVAVVMGSIWSAHRSNALRSADMGADAARSMKMFRNRGRARSRCGLRRSAVGLPTIAARLRHLTGRTRSLPDFVSYTKTSSPRTTRARRSDLLAEPVKWGWSSVLEVGVDSVGVGAFGRGNRSQLVVIWPSTSPQGVSIRFCGLVLSLVLVRVCDRGAYRQPQSFARRPRWGSGHDF